MAVIESFERETMMAKGYDIDLTVQIRICNVIRACLKWFNEQIMHQENNDIIK